MINQDYYTTHPHCRLCPHNTQVNTDLPNCGVTYQQDGSCFSKAEKIAEIQLDEEWARSRECYEYEDEDEDD